MKIIHVMVADTNRCDYSGGYRQSRIQKVAEVAAASPSKHFYEILNNYLVN